MVHYGNAYSGNDTAAKKEWQEAMPPLVKDPLLIFDGTNVYGERDRLCLTEKMLDTNMIVIGDAGSGKTNTLTDGVRQIIDHMSPDEKLVLLDVKGDYTALLKQIKPKQRVIYFGIDEYEHSWNIFNDILAFGRDLPTAEMRAAEIAKSLLSAQITPTAPYFANAAAVLFTTVLTYFLREAAETGDDSHLNNASLKAYLDGLDDDGWMELLDSYDDFASQKVYLNNGNGSSTDSMGVLTEINLLSWRIFRLGFAEKGSFSPVEFVTGKEGGILVLKSDVSLEEIILPVLTTVHSMMFKALGSYRTRPGMTTLVLDEFGRLPYIPELEMLFSLLRAKHIHALLGVQNVGQLKRQSDEKVDYHTVTDLIQNVILMRGSGDSVKYFQERFGTRPVVTQYTNANGSVTTVHEHRPVVETSDVTALEPGEAFVKLSYTPYIFRFRFDEYTQRSCGSGGMNRQ